MTRALLAAGLLLAAPSCGAAEDGGLRVYAAASLTEVMEVAAHAEARHAGRAAPILQCDGSARLVLQLEEGAPGDLLATADAVQMERARRSGLLAGEAQPLAQNHLVLAVAAGNPLRLHGLEDLQRADLRFAMCAPSVPAGSYARLLLKEQGIEAYSRSDEPSVRALLAKVALGELDAALVYATDLAAAAGEVEGVPLPRSTVPPQLWGAVLADARDPQGAQALLDFLRGDEGRALFRAHGFDVP